MCKAWTFEHIHTCSSFRCVCVTSCTLPPLPDWTNSASRWIFRKIRFGSCSPTSFRPPASFPVTTLSRQQVSTSSFRPNFARAHCKLTFDWCFTSERRKLVAAGLWQSGFHADWMYEGEGGGAASSRELLLALGWLLATGALESVVMKRVQKLDRMLLTCTPVSTTAACR